MKLVGESFPFSDRSRLVLTADNHNSVNGIREFARAHGAEVEYVPLTVPELRHDEAAVLGALERAAPGARHLFAYPAQSNYSGVRHPLEWIPAAQARGWDVLLDASAFVPTSRLDLSRWHPDFVAVSWYKAFGYPTGVGSLIVRHDALARLRRPWFAGGTIGIVSVLEPRHTLAPGVTGFEDGTIDFLALPAIETGVRFLETVGVDTIGRRSSTSPAGCSTVWADFATRTARPVSACTARRTSGTAAGPSRSTCSNRMVGSSTSRPSRPTPGPAGSRFAPAASATPARARPRAGSPPTRCAGCSPAAASHRSGT